MTRADKSTVAADEPALSAIGIHSSVLGSEVTSQRLVDLTREPSHLLLRCRFAPVKSLDDKSESHTPTATFVVDGTHVDVTFLRPSQPGQFLLNPLTRRSGVEPDRLGAQGPLRRGVTCLRVCARPTLKNHVGE